MDRRCYLHPCIGIYRWERTLELAENKMKLNENARSVARSETQLSVSENNPNNWKRSDSIETVNGAFWFTFCHVKELCAIGVSREGDQQRIGLGI